MSGHSKWHSIKHKKAKVDAERGRLFTRLIREITTAARVGGGDENANPRLRAAVAAAKAANMPAANIEKAIKKGTGELPGVVYEEAIYEGYGPGGAAIMVETLTDNKNRTVAEIRHLFSKYNGNLGENGCVAWMFEKKGVITVKPSGKSEDDLLAIALEAGAEDLRNQGETYEITTSPAEFENVKRALLAKNLEIERAELTMYPKRTVKVEGKNAETLLKLMDALEEQEDVQNLYSNFDIDDKVLEELEQS
ncbi:MAG: YebC/PmpR family DNA-binding transcriptional regulator [bacterium]|jgi:YebC/PmpR family DNA-binding regulatory protein|nr:YebC/PmpR family DNA-binding transcriptional regulator [candidate division KSB1 bacterium]MDH7560082.1 YebC/PmpR family DNA-binding transcriptional regulator [bacterium]